MMYSKTEGITADIDPAYSTTFNNHVVIVEQSADTQLSFVKASLAAGDTYTQSNWGGSTNTLTVEVCSITSGAPDKADVIAYVAGVTSASCGATTSAPTQAPVVTTTSAPTQAPITTTTSAPTQAPVVTTTSAPTQAPITTTTSAPVTTTTNAPTQAPVTTTECKDSPLNMKVNKIPRDCEWVAKNTPNRCTKRGVMSHCPLTCASPVIDCTSDSTKRIQLQENDAWKSCAWVRNKKTASRCNKSGMIDTCRATCAV